MTMIKSAVAVMTALMLSGCAAEMKEAMPTSTVKASWYSQGRRTASGERFNPREMTVAHRTLPFGTLVKLTNDNTGNWVVARVNDRGPFIKGRSLDVSWGVADRLSFVRKGVETLRIEVLNHGDFTCKVCQTIAY